MLQLRPNCECCNTDLAGDATTPTSARSSARSARGAPPKSCRAGVPNCGGELVRRPPRAADKLLKYPASTERVYKPEGCGKRVA